MPDKGDPPAARRAERSAECAGRLECLGHRKLAGPSLGWRALAHADILQHRWGRSVVLGRRLHTAAVRQVAERRTVAVAVVVARRIDLAEVVAPRTALVVGRLVVVRRPVIDGVSRYSISLNAITCMSCDERRRRRSYPRVLAAVEDTDSGHKVADCMVAEGLRHRQAIGPDIRLVIDPAEAEVVENIVVVADRILLVAQAIAETQVVVK